MPKLQIRA